MNMDFRQNSREKGNLFGKGGRTRGNIMEKTTLFRSGLRIWIFESPQCVKEALQEVVNTSVYGYNTIPDEYFPTIAAWLEQGAWLEGGASMVEALSPV